jgi:hypothetical protein
MAGLVGLRRSFTGSLRGKLAADGAQAGLPGVLVIEALGDLLQDGESLSGGDPLPHGDRQGGDGAGVWDFQAEGRTGGGEVGVGGTHLEGNGRRRGPGAQDEEEGAGDSKEEEPGGLGTEGATDLPM